MATNPLQQYNWGTVSFADDPMQVKSERDSLIRAGLWNPAWDEWFRFQGDPEAMTQGPATPDFSSLAGYGVGHADYGGGNRRADLIGPDGQVVVDNPYYYDEPSMGEQFAQGAAIVGGAALGANALFGGLGAGAGTGTLGTIAPGAGTVAPLSTMGTMGAATLPEVAGIGAGALGGTSAAGGYGGLTGGGLLTGNAGAALGGMEGLSGYGGLSGAVGGAGATGGLGGLLSSLGSANSLANLGSAAIGLYGQNQAIGAMQDATNQSNEFNRYAFDTIRADNKPLVDLRNSTLPQIQALLANPSSVMNDPGNQFQFAQGNKALENSAAGRGMTYSGAQGKALQRYGQDFASTKLDDSLRRLQSVAGLGQVGSNSNNAATQNYANNQSGNALNMGGARGSVYGNMANIGGNALSNIFNNWQYDQINGGR